MEIDKKESYNFSKLMAKAASDPDYKKYLELIMKAPPYKQKVEDCSKETIVREKLTKVVNIDNFSSKPYDWYWNYNKEQREEYFNKVVDELVLLNM